MNGVAARQAYIIAARFDRGLKLIRRALAEAELNVVLEFESAGQFRTLLVDCPLLFFEAQALDRAAGVFFPMHVLVRGDGERTQAFMAGFGNRYDVRLPSGAAGPMEKLQARVAAALESVCSNSGGDGGADE